MKRRRADHQATASEENTESLWHRYNAMAQAGEAILQRINATDTMLGVVNAGTIALIAYFGTARGYNIIAGLLSAPFIASFLRAPRKIQAPVFVPP